MAIERLTQEMAERIAAGAPGAAVAGAGPALRAALDEFMERLAFQQATGARIVDPFALFLTLLGPELEKVGLTMEQLRAFAEELDITLDENVVTWQQFLEAAEAIKVAELFKSLADQLGLLRREFDLFDRTPVERVQALLGHRNQATTSRYLQLDERARDELVREALEGLEY